MMLTTEPTSKLDYYKVLELEQVRYRAECEGEGVLLPKLAWSTGNSQHLVYSLVSSDGLKNKLKISENGITSASVRYSDSYIRELIFVSGKQGKSIMKTSTDHHDGETNTVEIEF